MLSKEKIYCPYASNLSAHIIDLIYIKVNNFLFTILKERLSRRKLQKIKLSDCGCDDHLASREIKTIYEDTPLEYKIDSTEEAVNAFRRIWNKNKIRVQEKLYAIYLDNDKNFICWKEISSGSTTGITCDTQLILFYAAHTLAKGIIIAHNHPSGRLTPSDADIKFTNKLKESCNILDRDLLEHIILTEKGHFSFSKKGLI